MNHERSKDSSTPGTIHSDEHTLSRTYRSLEGFIGEKYKDSQAFAFSNTDSNTTPKPLTAEDIIRAAKKQPKFTYNTVASDLLVLSAACIGVILAGGLVVSVAIALMGDSVKQLVREMPTRPINYAE